MKSVLRVAIYCIVLLSFTLASEVNEQSELLNQKGLKAYQDKNYSLALEAFQEALKLFDKTTIDRADAHHNIAECYKRLYQPQKAIIHYHEAITVFQTIAPRSLDLARIYNQLAQLYKTLGRYKKALEYHQQALTLKKSQPYPNQASLATSYNNIASIYRLMGRYTDALGHYQKALKIRESALGQKHLQTAQSYNNIATLYLALGNLDKAQEYNFKALKIRKIHNKLLYHSYHNIARTYQRDHNYTQALKFYHQSIQSNHHHPRLIWESYNNLAQIYIELGNTKEAYRYIQKALSYKGKLFDEQHLNTAILYSTLSSYYYHTQEYAKALKYQQKALDIQRESIGKESIDTINSYHQIAKIHLAMKRYDTALTHSKEAFDIFLLNQKEHYLILDNQQKLHYNNHHNALNLLSDLLHISTEYQKHYPHKAPKLIAKNFQRLLNYKGNINNRENSIAIIHQKITKLKNDIETLKYQKIHLSSLYQTYPSIDDKEASSKLDEEKRRSKKKISKLEIELNRSDRVFKTLLKLQEIDTHTLVSHLKANQLYIDFARTSKHYYIFTLNHKQTITFKRISTQESQALDIAIKEFRAINQKMLRKDKDINQLTSSSKRVLKTIYTLLDRYLHFKNREKYLIISPDALLNFIPFEALFDGNEYLIEHKNISYIPSGRELLRAFYQNHASTRNDMVIFGNPNYNQGNQAPLDYAMNRRVAIGQEMINMRYFKPLLGSLHEIESLSKLYPTSKIYQERNATVKNLLKIKNPKILHIATHGFFLKNSHPNVMQQSGLALAGANDAKLYCDTYGLVTALKLSTLQLSQTDLVVLSACDTGIGKIELSQGVSSLSRAFIQAGAKNVIMSLWSVDDRQTATLMIKFYKHLSQSNDKYIESLRRAKLEMINLHPYYWSGFVLNGVEKR